jgi:hypothetical protein
MIKPNYAVLCKEFPLFGMFLKIRSFDEKLDKITQKLQPSA